MTDRSGEHEAGLAYAAVDSLATWSEWAPFADVAARAPQLPGVYQIRLPEGTVVYLGMAGERRGHGLRGRLSIYRRGRGAVSGFGEAALDRALADAAFVEAHLDAVRAGEPSRASAWARDAIASFAPEIRWTVCASKADALALETDCVELLRDYGIWNRIATRNEPPTDSSALVSNGSTVESLTRELGLDDRGRAVRRALRHGFPQHERGGRWGILTAEHVAHVRKTVR